jgi:DNA-binding transcriptional LysR family regulator
MAAYSSHNLEAFVDVVRTKSFSSVARKRGLTPSSVARQISSLEAEIGVPLFIRSTRSLVPTEAGRLLYERADQILDDLDEAKRAATSLRKEVRGSVRLCVWPTFAKRCLLPHIAQLFEKHPELRIDLDLSERLHEPVLARTDLAIRIGELTSSSLVAVRLGTQTSAIAASPTYLKKRGTPHTLAECAEHRLIDKRRITPFMGWRILLGESRKIQRQLVLQTDDLEAQVDACSAGIGLVFLPMWTLTDHLRIGNLVRISVKDLDLRSDADVYLLRNPGAPTAAIDAVSQFVRTIVPQFMN